MRSRQRFCIVLGIVALAAACTSPARYPATEVSELERYATDDAARRGYLEASLVTRDNGYARLRLEQYRAGAWWGLPEWNPPVREVRTADLTGKPTGTDAGAYAPMPEAAAPWTESALLALGERAFYTYPLQVVTGFQEVLRDVDTAKQAGLWVNQDRVGGLVWVRLPDGRRDMAMTCATCHASVYGGRLVAGRNNPDIDFRLLSNEPLTFPGTVDVTADDSDNPVAITDLRPIRYQNYLHHTAMIRNALPALAVRIETLAITSSAASVRPPRKIAAALALYLWHLAPATPAEVPNLPGAAIFRKECGTCHAGAELRGEPMALATVGTDPAVGLGSERRTGNYRVPTLRFLGDRARLFAGGGVLNTTELLDPARKAVGHRYGLALSAEERRDLLAFLAKL